MAQNSSQKVARDLADTLRTVVSRNGYDKEDPELCGKAIDTLECVIANIGTMPTIEQHNSHNRRITDLEEHKRAQEVEMTLLKHELRSVSLSVNHIERSIENVPKSISSLSDNITMLTDHLLSLKLKPVTQSKLPKLSPITMTVAAVVAGVVVIAGLAAFTGTMPLLFEWLSTTFTVKAGV